MGQADPKSSTFITLWLFPAGPPLTHRPLLEQESCDRRAVCECSQSQALILLPPVHDQIVQATESNLTGVITTHEQEMTAEKVSYISAWMHSCSKASQDYMHKHCCSIFVRCTGNLEKMSLNEGFGNVCWQRRCFAGHSAVSPCLVDRTLVLLLKWKEKFTDQLLCLNRC